MKPINALLCLFLFITSTSMPAYAKYITLTHTVYVEKIISEPETTVNITLTNTGDEAAYDVQLSLILPAGMESKQIFLGKVDPNIPQQDSFKISISPNLLPGKYTMAILTEYKDANGYPFSSVTPNTIILKEPRSSQTGGVIRELTLGHKDTNKLILDLRNMDQKDHKLKIRVFTPKELKIDVEEKEVYL